MTRGNSTEVYFHSLGVRKRCEESGDGGGGGGGGEEMGGGRI